MDGSKGQLLPKHLVSYQTIQPGSQNQLALSNRSDRVTASTNNEERI